MTPKIHTLAPLNRGLAPLAPATLKVSASNVFKAERGSFKSLRVSSPVFVIVAWTERLSTSTMLEGAATRASASEVDSHLDSDEPDTFSDTEGAALTARAETKAAAT